MCVCQGDWWDHPTNSCLTRCAVTGLYNRQRNFMMGADVSRTISFNKERTVWHKHWNDGLPLLCIIWEAPCVLDLGNSFPPIQPGVPLPLGLSPLHPGNPAVTTKECTHKLVLTPLNTHAQTDNPLPCPFKHSTYKGRAVCKHTCAALQLDSQDWQKTGGKKKNK